MRRSTICAAFGRKEAEIEGIEDEEMLLDNGTLKKHEPLNMKLLGLDLSSDKMQCRAQKTKGWPCRCGTSRDKCNGIPTLLDMVYQRGLSLERLVEFL